MKSPKKPRSGELVVRIRVGKPFSKLRERMSTERRERNAAAAAKILADDERQARLDAIAEMLRSVGKKPLDWGDADIYVLASGRPARECRALVKKFGKEKGR